MKRTRRTFDLSTKTKTVAKIKAGQLSINQAARDLKVAPSLIIPIAI